MLPLDGQAAWDEYLSAEASGIRAAGLAALDRFIDALVRTSPGFWHPWARDLAACISQGAQIPVRFPLFSRVLLPALAEGVLQRCPGSARTLAYFDQLLLQVKEVPLPEGLRTAVGLLEEAVHIDPRDEVARRRLVEHHESYLQYTLHEIPAGVLYGMNGATPEQCEELLLLLADVRKHRAALGAEEPSAVLSACEFHFRSYREWLLVGRPEGNYAAFLRARGDPPDLLTPP